MRVSPQYRGMRLPDLTAQLVDTIISPYYPFHGLTPSISFCIRDAIRFVASMTSNSSADLFVNVSKRTYHGEVETKGDWMRFLLCQLYYIVGTYLSDHWVGALRGPILFPFPYSPYCSSQKPSPPYTESRWARLVDTWNSWYLMIDYS